MLIQLTGEKKVKYSEYLELYKQRFDKLPDALIRCETFFAVMKDQKPQWSYKTTYV